MQTARQRETIEAFGETYARRAGLESTLARGLRRCRLRRTRYRGQPKVQLSHILAATGLNFLRLGEWFGDRTIQSDNARPSPASWQNQ